MMNYRLLRRGALAALIIAGLALGPLACGSDEPSAPTPKPTGTAASGAADSSSDHSAPPLEKRSIGHEFTEQVELPAYYPSDGPVYRGERPNQTSIVGKRANAVFSTPDSIDTAVTWLNQQVMEDGWDLAHNTEMPGLGMVIQAMKGDRLLNIVVSRVDAGLPTETTAIVVAVDQ